MDDKNPGHMNVTQGHGLLYVEPLTPREQEVLALVAQGYSNNDIALTLVIAVDTVRNHLRSIYGKLGVEATGRSARIVAGLRGDMLRYVGPDAPCERETSKGRDGL